MNPRASRPRPRGARRPGATSSPAAAYRAAQQQWNAWATRPPTNKQLRPVKAGRWHPVTSLRRVWHTQPLRTRLALLTTALLTLGLLTVSLTVTSLLRTQLIDQVDDQLRTTSQNIGTQALNLQRNSTSPIPSTYYVEIQDLAGNSTRFISNDTKDVYGVPVIGRLSIKTLAAQGPNAPITTVDSSVSGSQWRVKVLPATVDGEVTSAVIVALPLGDVTETVEATQLVIALADVAIVVLGAMVATYLIHRSFRALRRIEGVAGQIAGGNLSARVPVTEPPTTEVGSLQRSLNTMLQQNERAFTVQVAAQERMTRFISDASHELRTPLAAIRGYGELYRMGGVPHERQPEVMGRIECEASRMGRLVEDLLQLARMDEGRKMKMSTVDLTEVCRGALTDMAVLAPERDCSLLALDAGDDDAPTQDAGDKSARTPGPVLVWGDRDRLSQVITNLLGNVTRHTPSGTPVEIAVGTLAGADGVATRAVVEVRDHGPGVPPEDAAKVFERFYRADTSRNRETGGSGLGLSIVSAILQRHGGTVQMLQTPGGGATVRMEIPMAAAGRG